MWLSLFATEISRAWSKLAWEVIHVNIQPPELSAPASSCAYDPDPNKLRTLKEALPSASQRTGGKRPDPSSALKADNLEEAPSGVNCGAPNAVFEYTTSPRSGRH
ncbi:hypothetical protein HOY80DRAFT_1005714 [Tuber brumale]|nr:hypothetical protein HOY80DRAFT_1005714 [Tuber brumale]